MSLNHTVTFVILVPAPRADDNPKALELSGRLNQLDKDLAQAEKNTLSSLRAPLNRSDPATDLTNRLKEQEVRQVWLTYFTYCLVTDSWILIITFLFSKQKTAAALQQLEKQRATAQKDLEPLLSHDINGPTFSTLPQKFNDAKNKQDSLAALNDLHRKKYVICSITQLYNSVWNKPQFYSNENSALYVDVHSVYIQYISFYNFNKLFWTSYTNYFKKSTWNQKLQFLFFYYKQLSCLTSIGFCVS